MGGFVHLNISTSHDSGSDVLINGPQPVSGQPHPAGHVLAWQMNPVAVSKNGLLPVERKMIAILAYDICAKSPGAVMQRSCRLGGKAAITGASSRFPRGTYLRRTNRRRKNRPGS
jgi:hypothetical protein